MPIPDGAFDIRRYLPILTRRKWLILTVAGTIFALAALHLLTTPPLYRATALLQADLRNAETLPSLSRKLRTRSLGQRVARELGLLGGPRDADSALVVPRSGAGVYGRTPCRPPTDTQRSPFSAPP